MPSATPMPIRQAIWEAARGGADAATLAARFNRPLRTVRHLLRCFRAAGAQVVAPAYRPGRTAPCAGAELVDFALSLRQLHPRWGAGMLRVQLARRFPAATLPHPRTIQRWLRQAALPTAPPGRKHAPRRRATVAHETWQVDASDQMRLASGEALSWLRLTDEHSGAILLTGVFPGVWNKVAMTMAQNTLRDGFERWGLPGCLRLDNGYPWGNWSELPTALALWLVGLGVPVVFNPPRRPRDNGVVERSHGVTKDWAEIETCQSVAAARARVSDMDQIQRQEYRLRNGKTRWEMFAELQLKRREYSLAWEEENWQESLARGYLGEQVASRQVDSQGKVSVYARSYYVGVMHKHRRAFVQYDRETGQWLFSDETGAQWCRLQAEQITAARIRSLNVSAKPSHNDGKTSCRY
jgi:hypothetical protein